MPITTHTELLDLLETWAASSPEYKPQADALIREVWDALKAGQSPQEIADQVLETITEILIERGVDISKELP